MSEETPKYSKKGTVIHCVNCEKEPMDFEKQFIEEIKDYNKNLTGYKVRRINSDYSFVGTIRAHFSKVSGQERFVVEDERGTLFIMSRKNFELLPDDYEEKTARWVKFTERQPTEEGDYHLKGRRGYRSIGYWGRGDSFSFIGKTAVNFLEDDDLYWLED